MYRLLEIGRQVPFSNNNVCERMACGCEMKCDAVTMSTPSLPVKKCLMDSNPTERHHTARYSELMA